MTQNTVTKSILSTEPLIVDEIGSSFGAPEGTIPAYGELGAEKGTKSSQVGEVPGAIFQIQGQTVEELKGFIESMKAEKQSEYVRKIRKLEEELNHLKTSKKYGIVFEEKKEDFEDRARNALPVLQEVASMRVGNDAEGPTNIIIEGDNYHALSCLRYTHKGKVDVIYIDPPYNTGNKDFIYNDRYVDKEDTYRHSKWLSFMKKRLILAQELLSESGVIFISIDDNEQAQLKMLCDEVFGEGNLINQIVIKSSETSGVKMSHVDKKLPKIKEYVLFYGKNSYYTKIKPVKISKIDNVEKFKIYSKYYSKIITNIDDEPENWNIVSLKEYFSGKEITEDKLFKFKIENSNRIIYRTNNKTFEKLNITEKIKKIISPNGIYMVGG